MAQISLSVEGRVARLRLARPERRNAITSAMLDEITAACRDVAGSDETDVVVLSAEGPSFSVGFDLDEIAAGHTPHGAYAGSRAIEALLEMPQVTVAVMRGWVVGGGAALAAACDLRIGDASTVFRIPEVQLGIPLGWGAMPLLVAELGPSMAKDLVMTGRDMAADEAHARGLLTRLVDDVEAGAEDLIAGLLAAPSGPLRTTKMQADAAAAVLRTGGQDAQRLIEAVSSPAFRAVFEDYLARLRSGG